MLKLSAGIRTLSTTLVVVKNCWSTCFETASYGPVDINNFSCSGSLL